MLARDANDLLVRIHNAVEYDKEEGILVVVDNKPFSDLGYYVACLGYYVACLPEDEAALVRVAAQKAIKKARGEE